MFWNRLFVNRMYWNYPADMRNRSENLQAQTFPFCWINSSRDYSTGISDACLFHLIRLSNWMFEIWILSDETLFKSIFNTVIWSRGQVNGKLVICIELCLNTQTMEKYFLSHNYKYENKNERKIKKLSLNRSNEISKMRLEYKFS